MNQGCQVAKNSYHCPEQYSRIGNSFLDTGVAKEGLVYRKSQRGKHRRSCALDNDGHLDDKEFSRSLSFSLISLAYGNVFIHCFL